MHRSRIGSGIIVIGSIRRFCFYRGTISEQGPVAVSLYIGVIA